MTVALSSSSGVAICYVLPALRMTHVDPMSANWEPCVRWGVQIHHGKGHFSGGVKFRPVCKPI